MLIEPFRILICSDCFLKELRHIDSSSRPNVGRTVRPVIVKVLMNQLLSAPIMNSLFYGYIQFFATHDLHIPWLQRWAAKLDSDLYHTQVKSFLIWSPLQFINFYYVPSQFRLLYTSVGLVCWFAFLSFVGHGKPSSHADNPIENEQVKK